MQSKTKLLILIWSALIALRAIAADSGKNPSHVSQKADAWEGLEVKATFEEAAGLVKSFDYLIKSTTDPKKRAELRVQRASAALEVARIYRQQAKDAKGPLPMEKKALALARSEAKLAISDGLNAKLLPQAHFVYGMSSAELGDKAEALVSLTKALTLDPKFGNAGFLAFYIAEEYFDRRDYKSAIHYYQGYKVRMKPDQKRLADYKTAWCWVNQLDWLRAQKYLLAVLESSPPRKLALDVINDLGYVVTRHSTPQQSIEFSRNVRSPEDREAFLASVFKLHARDGEWAKASILLEHLLKVTTDEGKKLEFLLDAVESKRKAFASLDHHQSFMRAAKQYERAQDASRAQRVEFESEEIIRAFWDTYLGKARTPEKIDQKQVGVELLKLLEFHFARFPQSKKRQEIAKLWLELCEKQCLPADTLKIANLIKREPSFLSLHHKANGYILLYLVNNKRYQEALPYAELIYRQEKTPASLKQVLWLKYQVGKHEEVASIDDPAALKDPGVKELVRESSLSLARKAEEEKDPDDFKERIDRFIKVSDDPQAIHLAQERYLEKLLEWGEYDAFVRELGPRRGSRGLIDKGISKLMDEGEFEKVLAISKGSDRQMKFIYATAHTALRPDVPQSEILSLPADERTYLLSVQALSEPTWFLNYYQSIKKPSKEDTDRAWIAWQLAHDENAPVPHDWAKRFGDLVSEERREGFESPTVTFAKNLVFSAEPQALARLTGQIQDLRKRVLKELPKRSRTTRLEILKVASESEEKIAALIRQSPAPAGLSESEMKQYAQQIEGLAKGYDDQALTWRKSLKTEEANPDKIPYPGKVNLSSWPRPKYERLEKQPRLAAKLILLDRWKANGKIKGEDYGAIRAGILLEYSQKPVSREIAWSELKRSPASEARKFWIDHSSY